MNEDFQVRWASSAVRDLERIVAHIAIDSPARARTILARIKQAAAELHHHPHRGRCVPELQAQGIVLYRELVVPPWRIVYRVGETTVAVLSVFDSRQNIEDILLAKLTQTIS
jgi:plasmid stabilization system protein ParE